MASYDRGFALVVGIANYPHLRQLPDTVLNDARDVTTLLMDQTRCGYPPGQVKLLLDKAASADNVRLGLNWLAEMAGPGDTVMFFFSGHGGRIEDGPPQRNYLMPYDTDPRDLEQTAIDSQELTRFLRSIQAGRLLVLFDCCHAGGTGEIKDFLGDAIPGFKSGLDERYFDKLATGRGRVIIASSRATEASWVLPEMQNSLFTHHFLAALRGQVHTYGDGLIRILDVFNVIAAEVPKHKSQQHPILKAELETNFPIALYQGGTQRQRQLIGKPIIEHSPTLSLSAEAKAVLKAMFSDYERVIAEQEFKSGVSGSQVLVIRPITENHVSELPTVVKVASVSLIEQEWQAFQDFIRDRLPNSVGLRDQPILPPGYWGGLRYPMVGSGTFAIKSLGQYCREASLEDVQFVLAERLLKILDQLMQFNRTVPAFPLQGSYDPLLPRNLLIQPTSVPAGTKPRLISPETLPGTPLTKGEYVRLEGLAVTKVDLLDDTVSLNLPAAVIGPPVSYSVRLNSVGPLASYQANQIIEPLAGVVIETRQERLETEAGRALGSGLDPMQETLALPDGTELRNPLLTLPTLLSQYPDVRVGTIHGDLNLENILVDPETREVSLIDFAAAREDHLLRDFLRLETEILTKLIPEMLAQANLGAGLICPFYQQLHDVVVHSCQVTSAELPHPGLEKPLKMLVAIRRAASHYLFKPDDWTEYYRGLVIYLLGAMNFRNLDELPQAPAPLPKQVAFLGAATVCKELF